MSPKNINNGLFISKCILRDLLQEKNLRVLFWGAPPILCVPMIPWKYFSSTRKLKGSCLCKGRFQYLCILLRFGNTLELMALGGPHSGKCT
jgi:hypothetical protein